MQYLHSCLNQHILANIELYDLKRANSSHLIACLYLK